MIDHGNRSDWYMDVSGNRYHRKPTAAQTPPDTVDRVFDSVYYAIVIGVSVVTAWAMVGMLRAPEPAIERGPGTIECGL